MYKRIIVPLDGSELAEVALPYAEALAEKLGADIILLNVRAPSEDPDNPEHRPYLGRKAAEIEQSMKESAELPAGQKVKVEPAVIGEKGLVTHAAEEIVDYAGQEHASLIIMATHGRTGIKRWALGSTTDKVVRAAGCPVLLVRAGIQVPRKVRLDKLLVPLDGSLQSETVLPHAASLATRLKADLVLFHVVVPPYHFYTSGQAASMYGSEGIVKVPYSAAELEPLEAQAAEYLQKVVTRLAADGISAGSEVRTGAAGDEIIKAADAMGVSLVTMATHGESGFSRWEHGSIADKVLHAINEPLLLVRERAT